MNNKGKQVEGRVKLDCLAENCEANVERALRTVGRPGMDGLVAVVLEGPGFERLIESAEGVCHP